MILISPFNTIFFLILEYLAVEIFFPSPPCQEIVTIETIFLKNIIDEIERHSVYLVDIVLLFNL